LLKKENYKGSGVVARRSNGSIVDLGKTPPLPNLHHLTSSKTLLEELPLEKYQLSVIAAKGCPFPCTFCLYRGTRRRARAIKDILDEMKVMPEGSLLMVYDLDMLIDPTFTVSFAREIRDSGIKLRWKTTARAEQCRVDVLKEMKIAGCTELIIGLESVNKNTLNEIKKGITLERIKMASDACKKVGIEPYLTAMFGYPNDDHLEAKELVEFGRRLNSPLEVQIIRPLRNTPLYDQYKSLGLIKDDLKIKDYYTSLSTPLCPTLRLNKEEVERTFEKIKSQMYRMNHPIWKDFLRCLLHTPHLLPIKTSRMLKDYLDAFISQNRTN
jgi:radical SAM superfamily enzyme YgiQ (UPF0313 family)